MIATVAACLKDLMVPSAGASLVMAWKVPKLEGLGKLSSLMHVMGVLLTSARARVHRR